MAVVIMTLPLYTIDSSYDASKGKYKRTGLTVMEYMFCVLACALTSLLCDFVSTFPPEEVLEELAEFNDATKQLQQGEVPDDVNKDDIDVAMLTAATTTAVSLTTRRAPRPPWLAPALCARCREFARGSIEVGGRDVGPIVGRAAHVRASGHVVRQVLAGCVRGALPPFPPPHISLSLSLSLSPCHAHAPC